MTKEEIQEHRRTRLSDLVKQAGGFAVLGRMLGYSDGSYVSQMAKGKRAIHEDFVNECENLPGYSGWFHIHGKTTSDLFTPELQVHLRKLNQEQIKRIENLLRTAEGLPILR